MFQIIKMKITYTIFCKKKNNSFYLYLENVSVQIVSVFK